MKLRKTMVVLLLLVFAIGMTAFVGCGDKDNRKESEKYELVITDTNDPVSVGDTNRYFVYKYDGEEHYPTVVLMYDGRPSGINVDIGASMLYEGQYAFSYLPKEVGKYRLTYFNFDFFIESQEKWLHVDLQITVIIEE